MPLSNFYNTTNLINCQYLSVKIFTCAGGGADSSGCGSVGARAAKSRAAPPAGGSTVSRSESQVIQIAMDAAPADSAAEALTDGRQAM